MSQTETGGRVPEVEMVDAALDSVRDSVRGLAAQLSSLRGGPTPPEGPPDERMALLTARCEHLGRENHDLRLALERRAPAAGAQTDLLANLYVAGFHLHRSLDFDELMGSIREILINLVGAESFQIHLFDAGRRCLRLVADESNRPVPAGRILAADGIVGVVAKTGIPYFDAAAACGDFQNLCACVPMKAGGEVVGIIQVNRLFVQKRALTSQDHELFALLAEHAGTALLSAVLYRRWRGNGRGAGATDLFEGVGTQDAPAMVASDLPSAASVDSLDGRR